MTVTLKCKVVSLRYRLLGVLLRPAELSESLTASGRAYQLQFCRPEHRPSTGASRRRSTLLGASLFIVRHQESFPFSKWASFPKKNIACAERTCIAYSYCPGSLQSNALMTYTVPPRITAMKDSLGYDVVIMYYDPSGTWFQCMEILFLIELQLLLWVLVEKAILPWHKHQINGNWKTDLRHSIYQVFLLRKSE